MSVQNIPGKIGDPSPAGSSTRERLRVRPRTRWSDYISDLAWSRLGVETAEPSDIAVDLEVCRVLLGLVPRDPPQRKNGHKNE